VLLMISTSWEARITNMSYWHPAFFAFIKTVSSYILKFICGKFWGLVWSWDLREDPCFLFSLPHSRVYGQPGL
jgi:predicted benzoate:H+ symporter BenE